jgi:hypothetical protein
VECVEFYLSDDSADDFTILVGYFRLEILELEFSFLTAYFLSTCFDAYVCIFCDFYCNIGELLSLLGGDCYCYKIY